MNIIRHASVFDPRLLPGTVHVIGVGALGSAVALQLAKLGIERLHLHDHDRVEEHNLPNQVLYGPEDVGEYKVHAACRGIQRLTGILPQMRAHMVERREHLGTEQVNYVFTCLDSMLARKRVFEACAWVNPRVHYFSDGRMSARTGMVTAFDPRLVPKSREYLARWYPDEEVPVNLGTCGNVLSIGATASMVASHTIWHFIGAHGATPVAHWDEMMMNCAEGSVQHRGFL